MQKVDGTVQLLACRECGRTSPHLMFHADTDMATFNVASLTSTTENEIVILKTEPAERLDETGRLLETRANRLLSRDDLRFVRFLGGSDPMSAKGLSFAQFRERFRGTSPTYACPNCNSEKVSPRDALRPAVFLQAGGKIIVIGELALID